MHQRFDHQKSYKEFGTRQFAGIEYQTMVHEYVMESTPAFKDELFITSIDDFIMKIDFQLSKIYFPNGGTREIITTWPKLCNELLSHSNFGKFIKSATKFSEKNLNSGLDLNTADDLGRFELIVDYVKSNYIWDGSYEKYSSDSFKQFQNNKKGSSAELNLFLIGMLRAGGIDAEPLLISTRDHGKIKGTHPFEYMFNNVIVAITIDDKQYLTDATEGNLPFNRIPYSYINDRGLVIEKDGNTWIPLTSDFASEINKKIVIKIQPDLDSMKVQIATEYHEYDAYEFRRSIHANKNISVKSLPNSDITTIDEIQVKFLMDPKSSPTTIYSTNIFLEN